jgi:septum formation protein
VERLALAKALAISRGASECWVLAADTTVVCAGRILGKPESPAEACEMLDFIQGREHTVVGGICLWDPRAQSSECTVRTTSVTLRKLSGAEVRAYVASGEPLDKAGAYAIQGLGAQLVDRISGSYTNVVGLDIVWVVEAGLRRGLLKTAEASGAA